MISVVIILKNDLGIVDTINGLNNQDYDEIFEVVVVDRSTISYPKVNCERTLNWIKFDPKGKRFTIPEQRNIGVHKSTGNIIVFIDASCIPAKNWLIELVRPILDDGEKIVMGKTGSTEKSTLNDLRYSKLKNVKYVDESPTINLAISKDVFEEVGLFDESLEYGSDVDFTWRAIEAGYKIKYQSSAFVTHNWGTGKEEIKRTILYGKARARLYFKHWRTKWRRLLRDDSPVIIYPVLIIGLPISIFFPSYLLLFLLLVLKNSNEPNPVGIVAKHLVYGVGVLIEVKNQFLRKYVK